jgi:hypothetical protein
LARPVRAAGLAAIATSAWALLLASPPAIALEPVELELVLSIDTSTSVDEREFLLQTEGLANAFLHPDVVNAIRLAGPRGIAVSVSHWAGQNRQSTVVGWHLLRDGQDAAVLAARIAAVPRTIEGLTDIAGAIDHAAASIGSNAYEGERRVIDISGDGSSDAASSRAARDNANARGITVNGLVIHQQDYSLGELANIDLREHYANNVIGGPGAFMMTASDFEDFRVAIRRKLVREIIGPVSASR